MADKLGLFMRTKSMAELKQTNPIAILVILGPQIGNIFSRVTNALGGT